MVLQMISVNQGTGTSVPEKVKRGGGGHMMFIIKREIFEWEGGRRGGG